MLLGVLSVFSFDFLSLECLNDDKEGVYYMTVYLWCLIPLIMVAVIIIVGVARSAKQVSIPNAVERQAQLKRIKDQHVWMVLFLSYLVLPAVSSKQLQAFDCISLKSNKMYLRSDTSIDCKSDGYIAFKVVVGMFVALYQLVPIAWMFLLYQNKGALNPHSLNHDEKLATYIRDSNTELAHLRFLFVDYKCDKWWFEIADMYRRIMFIGVVPLISPRSATRASFGCILAVISVVYFREEQPYRQGFTNVIAYVAQFCILLTFYGAMAIETRSMITFGLQGVSLGVFLFVTNLVIAVLCFWFAWLSYHKEQQRKVVKETKADSNEDARGFSSKKFNTTFEALWRHSIPSSHTLVFYYTSYEHASICRRSGIPAQQRFMGVPLTLRHPHATVKADFDVFSDSSNSYMNDKDSKAGASGSMSRRDKPAKEFPMEECLVLSLPRRFLDPLLGYEQDNGLCMISSKVLSALRSTSFTAVVDSQPWLDGLVMLPPHCIVRSFLIMEPKADIVARMSQLRTRSSTLSRMMLLPSRVKHTMSIDVPLSAMSSVKSNEVSSVGGGNSGVFIQDSLLMKSRTSIERLSSVDVFVKAMVKIRQKSFENKLVPLYHYTNPFVANLILQSGLRMSTQGQGDGGVYVSTQGPASYGFGTTEYECT
jgi:hypothetical protein